MGTLSSGMQHFGEAYQKAMKERDKQALGEWNTANPDSTATAANRDILDWWKVQSKNKAGVSTVTPSLAGTDVVRTPTAAAGGAGGMSPLQQSPWIRQLSVLQPDLWQQMFGGYGAGISKPQSAANTPFGQTTQQTISGQGGGNVCPLCGQTRPYKR